MLRKGLLHLKPVLFCIFKRDWKIDALGRFPNVLMENLLWISKPTHLPPDITEDLLGKNTDWRKVKYSTKMDDDSVFKRMSLASDYCWYRVCHIFWVFSNERPRRFYFLLWCKSRLRASKCNRFTFQRLPALNSCGLVAARDNLRKAPKASLSIH